MESLLRETQLKEKFIDVSCRKLAAARRGGTDPLRRSLHVLGLLRDIHLHKTRLEDECSELLYIQLTPPRLPRQGSRLVIVLQNAPIQRVQAPPTPIKVPEFEIEDDSTEIVDEDEQDGGSMARKRKAPGIVDAGRQNSKHRFNGQQSGNSSE